MAGLRSFLACAPFAAGLAHVEVAHRRPREEKDKQLLLRRQNKRRRRRRRRYPPRETL